jgi:hypothetical protein
MMQTSNLTVSIEHRIPAECSYDLVNLSPLRASHVALREASTLSSFIPVGMKIVDRSFLSGHRCPSYSQGAY